MAFTPSNDIVNNVTCEVANDFTNGNNNNNNSMLTSQTLLDTFKKVYEHAGYAAQFLPILLKWNGPLKSFLTLKKIGSHVKEVCRNKRGTLENLIKSTYVINGINVNVLQSKDCVHTQKALASNNADVVQNAICKDQANIIQQMVLFEIISSSAIIVTQCVSLVTVWRELARVKNLLDESKIEAKKVNDDIDKLDKMVGEVQTEMLMFALFVGYDMSTEIDDDIRDGEFWNQFEVMQRVANEMYAKLKTQRDYERMLGKFQKKFTRCSMLYADIQNMITQLKFKVDGKIVTLKMYRTEQIKDGILNLTQTISNVAELCIAKDVISSGLKVTKLAMIGIFTLLSVANAATVVVTQQRLTELGAILEQLHEMNVHLKDIRRNIDKLDNLQDNLEEFIYELNEQDDGDNQEEEEDAHSFELCFIGPLSIAEENELQFEDASDVLHE